MATIVSRRETSAYDGLLERLNEYHAESWRHSQRVATVMRRLALAEGIGAARAADFAAASKLHDIGKTKIPLSILDATGRLTDQEFAAMRTHPEWGFFLLQPYEGTPFNLASTMALTHHERWDGTGYPANLASRAIPYPGRLMAVADCYEALRAPRAYKSGFPHGIAAGWIAERGGTHFDPEIVKTFVDNHDRIDAEWTGAYERIPEPTHETNGSVYSVHSERKLETA